MNNFTEKDIDNWWYKKSLSNAKYHKIFDIPGQLQMRCGKLLEADKSKLDKKRKPSKTERCKKCERSRPKGVENTIQIFTSGLSKLTTRGYYGDNSYNSTDCTGQCDDYCRCARITDTKVNELYYNSILNTVIPQKHKQTILGYCVERILQLCGALDKDNWEVRVESGYYGEETRGISLSFLVGKTVIGHILKIINLPSSKQIEYILELEYGYVLPSLLGRNWRITEFPRNSINLGQEKYYDKKLSQEIVKKYQDHEFPICICINEEYGIYRLIDGYHRFAATKGKEKIPIILGS
ncbi:MAG: hypothetical protein JSW11_00990 [Candidatus Heimdallarchaeota archaeon]|nr:MAG: hypothetical protein JSW11_00990 [Candidatus Heimdallarchaeota archaeon]